MKYYWMLQNEWTLKTLQGKKLKKSGTKNHTVWFHIHDVSRVDKSIETESTFVVL
jgi:hypothetical protein